MATWLDVLANDWQDQRGRVNPISVARGFTKRGRSEIDQQQQMRDMSREEAIQQVMRQRAARDTMSRGVDPMTYQPRTMEEVAVVESLLNPETVRSNLQSQNLNRAIGQQNLDTSRQIDPERVAGARLGNRAAEQGINFDAQLQPSRVAGQVAGVRGQQLNNEFTEGANPLNLARLGLVNTGLRQSNEFDAEGNPLRIENMRGVNRTQLENLVEQLATQESRVGLVDEQLNAAMLGNNATQQGINQSSQLFPERLRGAQLANQGASLDNQFSSETLPWRVETSRLGAQGMRYDVEHKGRMNPLLEAAQRTSNESGVVSLDEQRRGSAPRLRMLNTQAGSAVRQEEEAGRTQAARVNAINNMGAVSPQLQQYLELLPLISWSPQIVQEVQQRLNLPPGAVGGVDAGQQEQQRVLLDSLRAVQERGRDRFTPTPESAPRPRPRPGEPNAPLLPQIGSAIGNAWDWGTRMFGNMPSREEEQQIRSLLSTPEGRARLEQLYPTLSEEDKQKIQLAVKAVQGGR